MLQLFLFFCADRLKKKFPINGDNYKEEKDIED